MGSKLEENFTVTDSRKMENPMSKIVIENFGDWKNFRKILEDAWENIDYDPRENKFSQRRFAREILGSYAGKINSADFKKLSNLIIKEINIFERRKEKTEVEKGGEKKSAKEKYVQRDIPFGDKEDKIRFKSRDKDLSKDIDKILYH